MVKRQAQHTIYEIWNEWVADSVFIDHKPTKKEIAEICRVEKWLEWDNPTKTRISEFIHRYISAEKLQKIYTSEKQ